MPRDRRVPVLARAFTLIDLLVGLSLAGLTIAVAATVSVGIHQRMTNSRKQSEVDAHAKQLTEYVVRHVRLLGGGAVRPHMAISSRCETAGTAIAGCMGGGTQPLRILNLHPSAPQCPVVGYDAATQTVTFSNLGSCCVDSWASESAAGAPFPVVQIPQNSGGGWRYRLCQPSPSTCACNLQASAEGNLDLPPQAGINATWVGGVVALGRPIHWRLDSETHQIMEETDEDGDGVFDSAALAPSIYGMQVQYGYDDEPTDGVVELWQPHVTGAQAPRLRMVKVGLAVGVPVVGVSGSTVELFQGTSVSAPAGIFVRAAFGATALRNIHVFQ